jgi:hypothetical protein
MALLAQTWRNQMEAIGALHTRGPAGRRRSQGQRSWNLETQELRNYRDVGAP